MNTNLVDNVSRQKSPRNAKAGLLGSLRTLTASAVFIAATMATPQLSFAEDGVMTTGLVAIIPANSLALFRFRDRRSRKRNLPFRTCGT